MGGELQEAQRRPQEPPFPRGGQGAPTALLRAPALSELIVPPRHPQLHRPLHGRDPMRFKNRYLLFELVWKDGKFEESISESVGRL